jgi:7,8-dihydropterin-6-yl-methyl-4-(beta-D-ribofuranosyl)aminobenzene 5'-phosphate synthase
LGIQSISLKETPKLEIISLMDNTVDFLSGNIQKEVQSFRRWNQTYNELPFAEHGFSMLLRVFSGKKTYTILYDTGVSPNGVVMNAERMGIDLKEVSYIVLSHGHYDHFGGLCAVIKTVNKIELAIIAHENMVKRRATINSKGEIKEYPTFPKSKELAPAKIVNTKRPLLIADNLACVTGEIPRTVSFEKGLIQNRMYLDGFWQPDPLIIDERALVFNIEGKGLVVISGCAHAGIINTIQCAQKITGVSTVYAVFGGFHLAGKEFEKRITQTVKALKTINPQLIAPSHCTGWRALNAISEALPETFIYNSVGNRYLL